MDRVDAVIVLVDLLVAVVCFSLATAIGAAGVADTDIDVQADPATSLRSVP